MPDISEKNINAFLHFGWLPRTDLQPPFPEEWIPHRRTNTNLNLTAAGDLLRNAVQQATQGKKEIIVPLSGGLDSRAVLAILHEQGKDIISVTLGTPSTLDFEIGKLVASNSGIKHVVINVNDIKLETEQLVLAAKKTGDWTNIIETYWSLLIPERYPNLPIVSGFLGDFLAGSSSKRGGSTWEETKSIFCIDNRVSRDVSLTAKDFDPLAQLPTQPQASTMTDYEYLVYRVRHTCSLRPTVFTHNFGFVVPFRDKEWISYILDKDKSQRGGQALYQEIILHNWPEFFNLPCKNFKGGSISSSKLEKKIRGFNLRLHNKLLRTFPKLTNSLIGIDPMTNYTDFHNQIRLNPNIRNIIRENLSDLQKRNITPWLDLNTINSTFLSEHTKLSYQTGTMLVVLANLEINLKASS
jgi:hypothetical protein